MLTTDCPWCDGPMAVDATTDQVACDACDVHESIALDLSTVLADAA
jgi:primosomal protein N'